MQKSLSIIIPVYKVTEENRFKYFEYLIESISKNVLQFRNDDFLKEIIIVNDYVEENPYNQIHSVLSNYGLESKLSFINNEQNYGQAMSRNIGAKMATGDYLHFIDQDDYISDNYYYLLLNSKATDIIFGHPNLFYANNKRKVDALKLTAVLLYKHTKHLSKLRILLLNNIAYSTGQYIITGKTFFLVNGYPDLKSKGCDDYGILFNLAFEKNIKFSYCKNAIFTYRIHSTQNRKSLNMKNSLLEFFSRRADFSIYSIVIKHFKISRLGLLSRLTFLIFFNK